MVGDEIVFVALALYVSDIGSPSDVGLVLAAATLPVVALHRVRRRLGGPAAAPPRDDRDRPDPLRAARAARHADLHRRRRDLAHRRDRGAVRHRRGVLPAGLHGARAADGAGGDDPGGARRREHGRDDRVLHRAGAGDRARARARRRLGVRGRRAHVPRLGRVPHARPPARARRAAGARAPQRRRRPARGLERGPLARVDLGHDRGLLRRAAALDRAVDDARPDDRRGGVRRRRHLRAARDRDGRRHDAGLAARVPPAPAAPDARGVLLRAAVAGRARRVRRRRPAGRAGAAVRRDRHGDRAVRRLVGDGARRARAAAHAVARVVVRLDGLARAAAARLPARRAARRGVRREPRARRRQRAARRSSSPPAWLVRETWTMRRLDASHARPAEGTLAP